MLREPAAPGGASPPRGRCRPEASWPRSPSAAAPDRRRRPEHAAARATSIPADGQLEGFEIDVLRQIAKAIFGDPDGRSSSGRSPPPSGSPAVQTGSVDIVADAFTITCARAAARRLLDRLLRRPRQGFLVPVELPARQRRRPQRPARLRDDGIDLDRARLALRPRPIAVPGRPAHRLPGRAPAGRRSTPSPATTRSCSASTPRTPTPGFVSRAVKPRALRDGDQPGRTPTSSASSTACSPRSAPTAPGGRSSRAGSAARPLAPPRRPPTMPR